VFAGFRFPQKVISVAVRWYLRYGLSYRDVEELLAERGITVDHVSTSSRWPSDQPVSSVTAPCHAHRSGNATVPLQASQSGCSVAGDLTQPESDQHKSAR
jgi:hypothetical protein